MAFSPRFVSNGMTFAQQEPSAKAPCTRTMVLIAMILLLVSKACRLNVAVVHAGHYRTGTTVRPVKQSKTAPRSSTCRVQLHWRLGQGADHGRMARVAEAWNRSTAPGATSRSTISSASVRLQRLRLACRSGVRLIPILAMRHGRARPGHACLWTDRLNPL